MADQDLRELERRYEASGALADRKAWVRARVRAGDISALELGGGYALDPVENRILRDKKHLKHSDADTFEVLHPDLVAGWARDRKRVWRFGIHCRGLKPASLRVLNRLFVTDGRKVTTLSGFGIAGADAETFETLGDAERMGYARDAYRVYFFDTGFKPRVLDVARESFRVIEGPFATDGEWIYCEAYLTKGKLEGFELLEPPDPTRRYDRPWRWRDATHTYEGRHQQGPAR